MTRTAHVYVGLPQSGKSTLAAKQSKNTEIEVTLWDETTPLQLGNKDAILDTQAYTEKKYKAIIDWAITSKFGAVHFYEVGSS